MSSTSETSSGSEVEASTEVSPQRGTTFASRKKGAFELPQGAVLIGGPDGDACAIEMGEFEWDSVKDDKDIELWLVRVPNSVCSLLPPFSAGMVTGSAPFRVHSRGSRPLNEAP